MIRKQHMISLQELAASQWGLITTAQAKQCGISRKQLSRMAHDGRLANLAFGVYRFSASPSSYNEDIKVAWLSINPSKTAHQRLSQRPFDCVIGGRTASYIHGIGDFYPTPFTFIVPSRRQSSRNEIHFLQRDINQNDIHIIDDLPVTTVERTITDLIQSREDRSLVDNLIEDTIKNCISVDISVLAELLSPLAKRNGYKKGDGLSYAEELFERQS